MKQVTVLFFIDWVSSTHGVTLSSYFGCIYLYGLVAMDVEDAENEVSVSSAILNSIASRQNEVLSPEDLAWVESCLVKDSDISDTDWIPLKNALLDIISSQPQSFSTEGSDKCFPSEVEDCRISFSSEVEDCRIISFSSEVEDCRLSFSSEVVAVLAYSELIM